MTLAHHTRNPAPEPARPAFEPVAMPSVFDAMVELYPSQKTLEEYDRTTRRLFVAGCTLALALLGVLALVAWGAKP